MFALNKFERSLDSNNFNRALQTLKTIPKYDLQSILPAHWAKLMAYCHVPQLSTTKPPSNLANILFINSLLTDQAIKTLHPQTQTLLLDVYSRTPGNFSLFKKLQPLLVVNNPTASVASIPITKVAVKNVAIAEVDQEEQKISFFEPKKDPKLFIPLMEVMAVASSTSEGKVDLTKIPVLLGECYKNFGIKTTRRKILTALADAKNEETLLLEIESFHKKFCEVKGLRTWDNLAIKELLKLYLHKGDIAMLMKTFKKIDNNPPMSRIYVFPIQGLVQAGKFDEAESLLQKLKTAGGKSNRILDLLEIQIQSRKSENRQSILKIIQKMLLDQLKPKFDPSATKKAKKSMFIAQNSISFDSTDTPFDTATLKSIGEVYALASGDSGYAKFESIPNVLEDVNILVSSLTDILQGGKEEASKFVLNFFFQCFAAAGKTDYCFLMETYMVEVAEVEVTNETMRGLVLAVVDGKFNGKEESMVEIVRGLLQVLAENEQLEFGSHEENLRIWGFFKERGDLNDIRSIRKLLFGKKN